MDIVTTIVHLIPALALGALLVAATLNDVLTHRIPNSICLLLLVSGLACQYALAGLSGVVNGLAGMAIGLVLLLPFYAMGGMAAGDVKLLAGAASFLGPVATVVASLATLLVGGLVAICLVALHAIRQARIAGARAQAPNPARASAADDSGSLRFPYALAITPGVIAGALTSDSLIAGMILPGGLR
jgi:prepilin peptidase CpaA